MTLRLAKRDRGIALIIVMIIVAALTVIVTGFSYSMRVENKLAYNTRFNPDMDWLGRSGVEWLAISSPSELLVRSGWMPCTKNGPVVPVGQAWMPWPNWSRGSSCR